jgi:hypothetical protein
MFFINHAPKFKYPPRSFKGQHHQLFSLTTAAALLFADSDTARAFFSFSSLFVIFIVAVVLFLTCCQRNVLYFL